MTPLSRIVTLLATTLVFASPLQAAGGGIDSFGASASTVNVGDTVDFWVQFSVSTSSWTSGGSSPDAPAPAEGYQEWNVNWYSWEHETLRSVWLQAGDQGFNDAPASSPGSGYSSGWSFSITFAQAGSYDIGLTGGWEAELSTGYSNESASRNCYYTDPDYSTDLACDAWYWQYGDYNDTYSISGSLSAGPLNVQVLAVPEPATWALWLAGAGLLGWRARPRA